MNNNDLFNNVFKAVMELDLNPIKTKLMHVQSGEGWSEAKADAIELEYRRFLCLMKLYPNESTAPLVDVDTFWHYHILDTMKYARDCQQAFGYFLHHYPYVGMRGANDEQFRIDSGERMRELYEATFAARYPVTFDQFDAPQPAAAWNDASVLDSRAGAISANSAWCASERPAAQQTAWCASERPAAQQTAWCASERPAAQQTAWCASERPAAQQTAWCASERPAAQQTAWCASERPAAQQTAWCASERPAAQQTAWCASERPAAQQTAWCASERPAVTQVAWCASEIAPAGGVAANSAYCASAAPARKENGATADIPAAA